ncbi:hypothetical protein WDU94_011040 [Cyamophila willieti]
MVLCLAGRHPLVPGSIVLLVWIGQVQCLIDKEKDLEGLVNDSSIDTHEIPLKYDLFRERVLPELLQTVPDDIVEDYINQIPEVDATIDTRHTTIVYRHDHLYYTAPHDLYRKLRYYKWKFRSRRRRTTPTPEPSFTLNEEDFLDLRNQVNLVITEKHELVDPDNPPTRWFTRNTQTNVYPAQRLHSVILKKQFFDKAVPDSYYDDQWEVAQGRATNPLMDLVGMTFNTVFRTMRRLNRTVTFIPFRIGSWRTSSWYPVTTAYYMYPNYTLPTYRTRALDMYDYDKAIFPMVTSKPFAIIDEDENRKRFSLAIVERMKQRELQIAMRTVNTSYLKYVMKPYKYPTVPVGPTLPSTPAPYYPGFKQWFTKEAPLVVTHSIEVLKGSKNHTVKMMKMDLDLEDDLFDMDINDLVTETKITKPETDLLSTTTEHVHTNVDDKITNVNAIIDNDQNTKDSNVKTTNMENFDTEDRFGNDVQKLEDMERSAHGNDNDDQCNTVNIDDINENRFDSIKNNKDSFNYNDDSRTPQTEIQTTKKRSRKSKRTTKVKRKRKVKKMSDENEDSTTDDNENRINEIYDDNRNDNYDNINENDSSNYNKDSKKRSRKSKSTTKVKRKSKVKKMSGENEDSTDDKENRINEIYDDNRNDNYDNINENDSPNYNKDGDTETDPESTDTKKRGGKKVNVMSKLLNKYERNKKPIHNIEKRSLTTTRVNRDDSKEETVAKATNDKYSNFKSLLLKRLSQTKGTKVISTYTFRTRKIPALKRKMFRSEMMNKKCETTLGKTTKLRTVDTEKTTKPKSEETKQSNTMGLTNLKYKVKTSERKRTTRSQKSQTKKKASGKTTNQKIQQETKGYPLIDGEWKDPSEEVKKGKIRKKSRAEREEELLHMLYPPVTLDERKENIDSKYKDQLQDYANQHDRKLREESEGLEKKAKRRKKGNEQDEEFLHQIYPPVTIDEEWVKEYNRRLRPTIPHNMSKHEYVRGFYTYGTSDENVETYATMIPVCPNNDTNLHNQAGYFPRDTNLFSSQENIKFQEVINLYNKYAKEFLQEAISTRKSRKKTMDTTTTTLEVNTKDVVMTAMEQNMRRNWTRPFIQCNWSNFIYY